MWPSTSAQTDNEYTGLLAGKNVILVQLEAIDTWMLQEAYMPNLSKLKAESISFTNHYTPATSRRAPSTRSL